MEASTHILATETTATLAYGGGSIFSVTLITRSALPERREDEGLPMHFRLGEDCYALRPARQ